MVPDLYWRTHSEFLYVTSSRPCVRVIDLINTVVTTVGSEDTVGTTDGQFSLAQFKILQGIAVDTNSSEPVLYVGARSESDSDEQTEQCSIRMLDFSFVS